MPWLRTSPAADDAAHTRCPPFLNLSAHNSPPLGAHTFTVVFGFDTPRLAAGSIIATKLNQNISVSKQFCFDLLTVCSLNRKANARLLLQKVMAASPWLTLSTRSLERIGHANVFVRG